MTKSVSEPAANCHSTAAQVRATTPGLEHLSDEDVLKLDAAARAWAALVVATYRSQVARQRAAESVPASA